MEIVARRGPQSQGIETMVRKFLTTAAFSIALASPALAQSIGGNASLSVTTATANVVLPAASASYPALLISPAPGATGEVFYDLGVNNTVAATTASPALPPGGLCFASVGNNTYLAAITASGAATLRLTQLSQCPPSYANASAANASGGTVTANQGTSPWLIGTLFAPISGGQHPLSVTTGTTLTIPSGAVAARICAYTGAVNYGEDGSTPGTGAGQGVQLSAMSCTFEVGSLVLAGFEATAIGAGAVLDVTYYRYSNS